MKFALNYSLPAVELVEAGEIEVDYLKFPDWPDLVAREGAHTPAVVHFDLAAGRNKLDEVDWGQVEGLLSQTQTHYVNLHFYPSTRVHGSVERAVDGALADIRSVVTRFGAENVIVENLPYPMPEGDMPPEGADPATISQVLRDAGCGLLLDLAHAWITARNQDVDTREYLAAMPVERIREMHLTGVDWHNGQRTDHLAMTAADWDDLDWAAAQVREGKWPEPDYLAYEYGGIGDVFKWRTDREVIRTQVPRIVQTIR